MEGMTYLAVAYLGMLMALGLWTYTVMHRSRRLEQRLQAMEIAAAADADSPVEHDS